MRKSGSPSPADSHSDASSWESFHQRWEDKPPQGSDSASPVSMRQVESPSLSLAGPGSTLRTRGKPGSDSSPLHRHNDASFEQPDDRRRPVLRAAAPPFPQYVARNAGGTQSGPTRRVPNDDDDGDADDDDDDDADDDDNNDNDDNDNDDDYSRPHSHTHPHPHTHKGVPPSLIPHPSSSSFHNTAAAAHYPARRTVERLSHESPSHANSHPHANFGTPQSHTSSISMQQLSPHPASQPYVPQSGAAHSDVHGWAPVAGARAPPESESAARSPGGGGGPHGWGWAPGGPTLYPGAVDSPYGYWLGVAHDPVLRPPHLPPNDILARLNPPPPVDAAPTPEIIRLEVFLVNLARARALNARSRNTVPTQACTPTTGPRTGTTPAASTATAQAEAQRERERESTRLNGQGPQQVVLCRVTASSGQHGVGFAVTHGMGEAVVASIKHDLAPLVINKDPRRIEQLWSEMSWFSRGEAASTPGAVACAAVAAVDTALWDLRGTMSDTPLWVLAGGGRAAVRAYQSSFAWAPLSLAELREQVEHCVLDGFRACKLGLAGCSVRDDADRVLAAASAAATCPGFELILDGGQRLSSAEGLQRAHMPELRAANVSIAWLEDLLPADDVSGHERVARTATVPLGLGCSLASLAQFREFLKRDTAHIVCPDVSRLGGITPWLKVAHLAEAHNISVCTHGTPELHVSLACAVSNGLYADVAPALEPLVLVPMAIKDGLVYPPRAAGLGISWNWMLIVDSCSQREDLTCCWVEY